MPDVGLIEKEEKQFYNHSQKRPPKGADEEKEKRKRV
jgi:hypothetical protein